MGQYADLITKLELYKALEASAGLAELNPDYGRDFAPIVSRHAGRARRLSDGLARLVGSKGAKEMADLAALAHDVASLVEARYEKAGTELRMRLGRLPLVEADPGLFQAALMEVLGAAVRRRRL